MDANFGGGEDIQFSRTGRVGVIHLNRPKVLNSLTIKMVKALRKALTAWEEDETVGCVLISGEGRAFCSGSDIVSVYNAGKAGKPAYDFFAAEYALNAYLGRFSKPYISLLNGIVMGGGAGISVHGSHRIVTESTVFAMPETAIGFFCDVGAGHFLPRIPGNFGIYLGLTGERIRWGDCLQSGIATHAVAEKDLTVLKNMLIELGDPRPALEKIAVEPDFETSAETRSIIEECFGGTSLDECISRLQQKADSDNEFAATTLGVLKKRSPTSLRVIFRQLVECRPLGLDDCMRIEYKIAHHMLDSHDFYEGVRAVMIDKDQAPQWQPDTIEGVTGEIVNGYFEKLDKELVL